MQFSTGPFRQRSMEAWRVGSRAVLGVVFVGGTLCCGRVALPLSEEPARSTIAAYLPGHTPPADEQLHFLFRLRAWAALFKTITRSSNCAEAIE